MKPLIILSRCYISWEYDLVSQLFLYIVSIIPEIFTFIGEYFFNSFSVHFFQVFFMDMFICFGLFFFIFFLPGFYIVFESECFFCNGFSELTLVIKILYLHLFSMLFQILIFNHVLILFSCNMNVFSFLLQFFFIVKQRLMIVCNYTRLSNMIKSEDGIS